MEDGQPITKSRSGERRDEARTMGDGELKENPVRETGDTWSVLPKAGRDLDADTVGVGILRTRQFEKIALSDLPEAILLLLSTLTARSYETIYTPLILLSSDRLDTTNLFAISPETVSAYFDFAKPLRPRTRCGSLIVLCACMPRRSRDPP